MMHLKKLRVKAFLHLRDKNTLTLKNVVSKTAILAVLGMGDDFKIKLEGYNELSGIMSVGMEWGGSVTLTGDGELVQPGRFAREELRHVHVEDFVELEQEGDRDVRLAGLIAGIFLFGNLAHLGHLGNGKVRDFTQVSDTDGIPAECKVCGEIRAEIIFIAADVFDCALCSVELCFQIFDSAPVFFLAGKHFFQNSFYFVGLFIRNPTEGKVHPETGCDL